MKIEDLQIPESAKKLLIETGFDELYPPQEEAVKAGALDGKNLVLASPTASGKTLVAELCALKHIIEKGGKVLYLTPLRALASEKYDDFQKYSKIEKRRGQKIKIAISTGDYDSSDSWLEQYDLIITTNEKCLSGDEEIVVVKPDFVEIMKISEFYNQLEIDSVKIESDNKVDIVPNRKIYTLAFDVNNNQLALAEVESVTKVKNKEKILRLQLESGRTLKVTPEHKIFTLNNGSIHKLSVEKSLNSFALTLKDSSSIFNSKLYHVDVLELIKKAGLLQNFSGTIACYDFDKLIDAIITLKRWTKRKAKDLAKYYVRNKILPLKYLTVSDCAKVDRIGSLRKASGSIPTILQLNEALGKLVGYYISEGSSGTYGGKRHSEYRYLRIFTSSEWVKNDIVDSLKLLGIGFHLYVDKRNRFEIRVSSKPLYTLFIEIWGLGRRSGDKKLPTFAFYANDDFIRGLLSALFAGDVGPSPTALEYSTKSRTLALQISLLLSRFNIHTKIYQQQIGNPNATYWRVAIIASTNFKRLLPLLSSTPPHILSHSLKIALEVRGRDDQLENVPAREIISNSQALMDHDFYVAWQNATRISRDKMKTLAKLIHDVELERRLSSPVGFLKVIQLNEAGEDYVFNLKTNFGNYFTAQGLLVSNCDSLLRHRAHWMRDISLVVADEVHLLNDLDRGPTLEVVLARLLQINPDAQFLALSATIRNAEEIAEWLKAKSITTEWRPVKLKEGVYLHGEVEFKDGSSYKVEEAYKNPAINMVARILKQRGQALIFAETRKASVELATKASLVVKNFLSKPEERSLKEVSTRILGTGERTRISKLLAELITRGTAFHHAGLYGPHRKIVEDSFRAGKIKVVVATPTLAAGVNLPARLVVINSYERFEPGYGRYPIPVLEYKQMAGRAGRPKYDKIGEAILIARTPDEQEYLMENYICAQPERIWSRLAVERVLRSHVLATLASGFAHTEQGLYDFFDKTFYAFQYDPKHIRGIVGRALKFLADEEMVHFDRGNIVATEFGRRVSELYIDPESAVIIRDGLYNRAKVLTDISFLHMICHTPDMAPKFYPRRKELKELELYFDQHREELMFPIPDEWTDRIAFEEYLAELKGTRVLECWINEMSEDDIIERYAVEPGDLFRFVENANWLLYASHELAQLFHHKDLLKTISVLRERVVDGVKSELLPLVRLEGIGRVRARLLYNAGFRTIDDLKKASISQLTGVPLIGLQIAKKIKDQVGGLIKLEDLKRLKTERGEEQASLTDYK